MVDVTPSSVRSHADSLRRSALTEHSAGRYIEAEGLYRECLKLNPEDADCLHLLGGLALQTGRFELALEMLRGAVDLDDSVAEYQYNLATAYSALNRTAESIYWFESALIIRPEFFEALCDLGDALVSTNRGTDAVVRYQEAIQLDPNRVEVLVNLGCVFYMLGRFEEAIDHFERCLVLSPDNPDVLCNLGNALYAQCRYIDAVTYYERSLSVRPGVIKTLCNLGDALLRLGRFHVAETRYVEALAIDPSIPEALCNLGDALQGQGRLFEAISRYRESLLLRGRSPEAYCNLGNALLNLGCSAEALDCYYQALALDSKLITAFSNSLMCLHYTGTATSKEIFDYARGHIAALFPIDDSLTMFERSMDPLRRLRVGYVSGDFGNHPVGYFLANVLPFHSPTEVEVFCYSNYSAEDEMTFLLRRSADHWCEIGGISDQEARDLIQRDCIDILVDLSGHTLGNRLSVFSKRAAPVQVSWLGYFGTTGLPTMDYVFGDRFVTPVDSSPFFVESVVRLPDSYLCFSPPIATVNVHDSPCMSNGHITFGCFSNLAKLSPQTLAMWSAVLHSLPNSRLLLKAKGLDENSVRGRILSQFVGQGIAADRLEFEGASSRLEYLKSYHRVDLMLDTTPFSGGTTTVEALWMGVPVITLRGTTWAGRICESILVAAGLPELVASDAQSFVEIAGDLARNMTRLSTLRGQLRDRLLTSPLCDSARFSHNLEDAYRTMWGTWCDRRLAD